MATGKNVLTKKDGVDEYAFYIEMVKYRKNVDGTPGFAEHARVMVFRDRVYVYGRTDGKKASRWKTNTRASTDAAMTACAVALQRLIYKDYYHVEMRGEPLLLQVRPSDIEQYEKNNVPDIRYAGMSHFDSMYGKITDASLPVAETGWVLVDPESGKTV
jgi:hypothetical protein